MHFPLFSKISVLGADQHPLYAALTSAQPDVAAGDARLVAAIDAELAKDVRGAASP